MENDTNEISHLDGNLLLPPRKRLLPGMRRQNLDMNLSKTSSFDCNNGSEFEARMNNLLETHLSSNPNLSNEEIVEASRLAAIEKSKVAKSARALAEEKAAKAATAIAAARKALELVATLNEESDNINQEKYLKKNKLKKHVAIQSFYDENNGVDSSETYEELARELHQVINSSSRSLKKTGCSDLKNKKAKLNVDFVDDDQSIIDKKKMPIKHKILPMSICNVKDLEIPNKSLFCVGDSSKSVEKSSRMWKCKGFKVQGCVKQNKVMQS